MGEPYGTSITKRLAVRTAEEQLFIQQKCGETHYIELVDYIGGDAMIERVATAGHGTSIFPEKPTRKAFLNHLKAKSILTPFKSVHLKFKIQCSIKEALDIVYEPKCSVNEYSGRYSVMIDTSFLPSIAYLAKKIGGPNAEELAIKARELMKNNRELTYKQYKEFIDEYDLARELARTPTEVHNDTMFMWKMELLSLVEFIKEKSAITNRRTSLKPYLETLKKLAEAVAPLGTAALFGQGEELELTYPKDEEVIDKTPLPAQWEPTITKRVTVPELEKYLFEKQDYLAEGAIQAVDYMADDRGPVESARISYGKGTVRVSEDKKLLCYLYRNRHTSPFEHCELAVEGKTPIFVDPRQAGRHRTLDNHCFMGELLIGSQYFIPPAHELRHQDRKNKQGRGNELDDEYKRPVVEKLEQSYNKQLKLVKQLRELGVDEETARGAKGVGFYTYRWRTGDMHNWLHFLSLRLTPHAQKEIYEYAKIIAGLVKLHSPTSYEALMNYKMNTITFTALDKPMLSALLKNIDLENLEIYKPLGFVDVDKLNREGAELKAKLEQLREKNDTAEQIKRLIEQDN